MDENESSRWRMNPHLNGHHDPERETESVRAFLGGWRDPDPDPAAKAALIAALDAEWDAQRRSSPRQSAPHDVRFRLHHAGLIVRAQLRVVGWVTWAASLLVVALGMVVTLILSVSTSPDAQTNALLPFTVLAPLVTALGVAFLYGEDSDPALELALAAPISPRVVLLARLAVLFAFNLSVALIGSAMLVITDTGDVSLSALILSWLAPMTFLSALAFLCSVLFFAPLMSALLALCLWAALVWRHYFSTVWTSPLLIELRLPDLLHPDSYSLLFAAAAVAVGAALWITGNEERMRT